MRPIKFRAWDKEKKKFLILTLTKDDTEVWYEGEENDWRVNGADLPKHKGWQQFTGLLDKNGKEIYEGDIVADIDTNFKGEVKWWTDDDMLVVIANGEMVVEVIGNIYENPELVGEDHDEKNSPD